MVPRIRSGPAAFFVKTKLAVLASFVSNGGCWLAVWEDVGISLAKLQVNINR
jgi:hypothetical protein